MLDTYWMTETVVPRLLCENVASVQWYGCGSFEATHNQFDPERKGTLGKHTGNLKK